MATSRTSTQGDKQTELFSDKWLSYIPTKGCAEANFDSVKADEARWCVNYEYARQSRLLCDKVDAARRAPTRIQEGVRRGPLLKFVPLLAFHVPEFPEIPWPKIPDQRREEIVAEIQQANNVDTGPASFRSWGSAAQVAKLWDLEHLPEDEFYVFEINLFESPTYLRNKFKKWVLQRRKALGIKGSKNRRGSENNSRVWTNRLKHLSLAGGRPGETKDPSQRSDAKTQVEALIKDLNFRATRLNGVPF